MSTRRFRNIGKEAKNTTILRRLNMIWLSTLLSIIVCWLLPPNPLYAWEKDARVKETGVPVIGIFRDEVSTVKSEPSNPDYLSKILKNAGYITRFLKAQDLADQRVLNRENIELLILPYGPSFPGKAVGTFRRFLGEGGSFFSMGGPAFDNLYPECKLTHLNTRRFIGDVHVAHFKPGHIGIFDSPNRFENVLRVIASEDQFIASKNFSVEMTLQGYSASAITADVPCAVFGKETARWVPILDGLDEAGNLKARIGAILYNYGGTYKNSRWAFFGVTNVDLFGPGSPFGEIFVRTINRMMQGVFSYDLKTDFMSYRQGEEVNASVSIRNPTRATPDSLKGIWTITDIDERRVYASKEVTATLDPGETTTLGFTWAVDTFERDFYKVRFDLLAGGELVDRMKSGFVVWNPQVFEEFQVSFRDAMFHINGVETFVLGTARTGYIFSTPSENPLLWQRDFAWMRDHGLSMFRVMHFSLFFDHLENISHVPEVYLRKLDALLQVAAKNRVILFLAAHSPWEGRPRHPLEQEGELLEVLGRRYKGITSLLFDTDEHRGKGAPAEVWLRINKDGLRRAQSNALLAEQINFGAQWPSVEAMLRGDVDIFSFMLYQPLLPSSWLRYRDYRVFGRSISFSEFGWTTDRRLYIPGIGISGELDEVNRHFHNWGHMAFTGGVNSMLHWSQRDLQGGIFPYGFFYNDGVVKSQFWPFRNMGIFFRTLRMPRGRPIVCLVRSEKRKPLLLGEDIEQGFIQDIGGWRQPEEGERIQPVVDRDIARSGEDSVTIFVPDGFPICWYSLYYKFSAKEAETYRASVYIKTENVREGYGAYVAFSYFRADGSRIDFTHGDKFIRGTSDWTKVEAVGLIPPETDHVRFVSMLHGRGQAWFDDVVIERVGDRQMSDFLSAMGDFAVISEEHLGHLPLWTRILMYGGRIPREHQKFLEAFLSRGGILYASGDIIDPDDRKQQKWMADLLGIDFTKSCKSGKFPFALTSAQLISQEIGRRQISFALNEIKGGKVIFNPYPTKDRESKTEILRAALRMVGKNPSYIPKESWQSISKWHPLFDTGGGSVDMVRAKKDGRILIGKEKGNEISIALRGDKWGVVHWSPTGEVLGVGAQGNASLNGNDLLLADFHYMVSSLDGKGLNKSTEILFLPNSYGKVSLRNKLIDFVLAGSIKNGRWVTEAKLSVEKKGEAISFEIPSKYREKVFLLLNEKRKIEIDREESFHIIE